MLQRMNDQGGVGGLDQMHVSGFCRISGLMRITVPSVVHELSDNIFFGVHCSFF